MIYLAAEHCDERVEMKSQNILSFFCKAIAICVCAFALLMAVASLFVMESSFAGGVAYGFFVFFIWLVLDYWQNHWSGFSQRKEILVLLVLCLAVHLFLIKLLPVLGRNELGLAWDYRRALASMLSGKICYVHNVRHFYWCNYEILLSSLAAVFGGSLELGQIVNVFSRAMLIFPLYALSECIAGRRIARFTVLSIMFSPALVMTSTLLTGEFLSSMFMFAAFYFAISMFKEREWRNVLAKALFGGVALGCSELFKTITIIFIIALIISGCMCALAFRDKRTVRNVAIGGLLFLLVSHMTIAWGEKCFAGIASAPQLVQSRETDEGGMYYEFALGLNLETMGVYNDELAREMRKRTPDQQKEKLKSMIVHDWRKYPDLMVYKFAKIYGSHCTSAGAVTPFTGYFRKKNGKGWDWYVPSWIEPLADYGMMFFEFIFILGAGGLLVSLRKSFANCLPGIFAALIVLGFTAILQVIEGYGRYRISIYPFYFMLFPYMCVWFEKDNPVYVRLAKWAKAVKARGCRNIP